MTSTNWLRQTSDKPLFPELIWSKPEQKSQSGKLLIIGGNKFGFSAPAEAFSSAEKAGIGSLRILLPDSLKRTVGALLEADFGSSTAIGSLSKQSLAEALDLSKWADGVLLAGDLGHNSETAVMLESIAEKYSGPLAIASDSLDYFLSPKSVVLDRPKTVLVINLDKLQKLAKNNRPSTPILHNMDLSQLVSVLEDWSNSTQVAFVTKHANKLVVAYGGKVSTTADESDKNWQVNLSAYTIVWLLQQPGDPFQSLSSAVYAFLD